jgi:hypothetical protein
MTRSLDPDSRLLGDDASCWRVVVVVRGHPYRPLVAARDEDEALRVAVDVVREMTTRNDAWSPDEPSIVGVPKLLHPVGVHHVGGNETRRRRAERVGRAS